MPSMVERLTHTAYIPVITGESSEAAAATASLLFNKGFEIQELVMGSPASWEALKAIRLACPTLLLGAGGLLNVGQCEQAVALGADFLLSPGSSFSLADAMLSNPALSETTWIPGVVTPSEMMGMLELGYSLQQLFPVAEQAMVTLKAVAPVFTELALLVSGVADLDTAARYLAQPNVAGVSGSVLTEHACADEVASLAEFAQQVKAR